MLEEGQFDGVEVGLGRRMGNGGGWGGTYLAFEFNFFFILRWS